MTHSNASRRGFLKKAALGGAAVGSAPALAVSERLDPASFLSPYSTTAADFRLHVGSRFRIRPATGVAFEVTLVEVPVLPSNGPRPAGLPRQEAFAAVFRCAKGTELQQQTCKVEHPVLGQLDLFLGSMPGADSPKIEAIFN